MESGSAGIPVTIIIVLLKHVSPAKGLAEAVLEGGPKEVMLQPDRVVWGSALLQLHLWCFWRGAAGSRC